MTTDEVAGRLYSATRPAHLGGSATGKGLGVQVYRDGNKRLVLASAMIFLARNGVDIEALDDDRAYDLMIEVAKGDLDEVPAIAERLASVLGS